MARQSAGILLHRLAGERTEVLLVHPGGPLWARRDRGAWSIPKGEHGDEEDARAAALRELAEELGSPLGADAELVDLGSIRQAGGKVVRAFAVRGDFDPQHLRSNTFTLEWPPRSGRTQEFPEVDRAQWFELGEARERLNPAQVAFLDRLEERCGQK